MLALPTIFLLGALAMAFYTLGAGVIEGQLNYRTWRHIGMNEFRTYHRALGPRIGAFLVVPFTVGVICTLALVGWRPSGVPVSAIALALALDAVPIAATLLWQLPAQRRLDRDGWSTSVVADLIRREWFRLIPHLGKALLLIWLVGRMLGATSEMAP